jgi:hypothetical protein
MYSVQDPTTYPGVLEGWFEGGPVPLSDPSAPATPVDGSLTCSVHFWPNNHHSDLQSSTATGPTTTGSAALPASLIAYDVTGSVGPTNDAYLCTSVTIASTGTTFYWDAGSAAWSTSATSSTCVLALMPVPEARIVP